MAARMGKERFGFTLVEMAVVLVIVALLITAIFPALTALLSGNRQNVTNTNLQTLMRATAAYVQANGCVPCPSPASALGTAFGVVGITVSGSLVSTVACSGISVSGKISACPTAIGIPPFVSLGLPQAAAHDGWGRWITMAVDTALTAGTSPVTHATGAAGICGISSNNSTTLKVYAQSVSSGASTKTAVNFISYGADGYGSFIAGATAIGSGLNGYQLPFPNPVFSPCASGSNEQCNASLTTTFVDTAQVVDPTGALSYGDMMTYLGRNALVSTFGNAACTTTW